MHVLVLAPCAALGIFCVGTCICYLLGLSLSPPIFLSLSPRPVLLLLSRSARYTTSLLTFCASSSFLPAIITGKQGINRDSQFKRRKTGGRRVAMNKKRKFLMGRPAAMTKLGEKRIHSVRTMGGNTKYRALRLDAGSFSWGSESFSAKTRVIDVMYVTLQYSCVCVLLFIIFAFSTFSQTLASIIKAWIFI